MTTRDHDDLGELVRAAMARSVPGGETGAIIAALCELIYELRARVEALELATGGPR